MLLEVEDKRLLLGGDAHSRVMVGALTGLAERFGTSTVNVDVFKLAHHGGAGTSRASCSTCCAATGSSCRRTAITSTTPTPRRSSCSAVRKRGDAPHRLLQLPVEDHPTVGRLGRAAAHRHQAVYGDDGHLTVTI